MESPSLSRSPSGSFAPGTHRRSHPNLQHLSLAPLTPRYPIDPADYDAYFDPTTSELHTSASISHISALPSPGGILTNSPARSRASSRNRLKRKTKSTVSIRAPTDTPFGALTSEGYGHKKSALRIHTDSSWLVQTGLALTEGSRESKGQSWIGKRESSTSLANLEERPRSGRTTPNRSRRSSRRRSRRNFAMTAAETPADYPAPDWADTQTQAEVAAQVESELADELDDDDPYGVLDFEGHFDSEDEEEVRKEISRYRLGRWMDGVVEVFLQLEEFDIPDLEAQNTETVRARRADPDLAQYGHVEPPPEHPKGVWDDVAWFGRLVARTVRS